jgi:hypothetical protein
VRYRLFVLLVSLIAGCSSQKAESDKIRWHVNCDNIASNFKACYGPGWTDTELKNPAKYSIYRVTVERIKSPDWSTEIFRKELPAQSVAPHLLVDSKQAVVRYEPASRQVFFKLGQPHVSFTLP